MGKAVECKRCKTDQWLKWKFWEPNMDQITWWIVCEGCGAHGEPGYSQAEAGEKWNADNQDDVKLVSFRGRNFIRIGDHNGLD